MRIILRPAILSKVSASKQILHFAAQMPYLPFIGWDIVMTADHYRVIETNPGSGFGVIQVHHPMLADARVKRFFQTHGML